MINKYSLFLLFFTISLSNSFGQFKEEFTPGIRLGANYSNITGVESTLYFADGGRIYTFNEIGRPGFVGGFFFNYKLTDRSPYFAVQGEVDYAMHGAKYEFRSPAQTTVNGDVPEKNEDITFRYNYLTFGGMFKYYILNNGFNIGIGPRLGFNLSRDNIFYESDRKFNDLGFQQRLRESLGGQIDFSIMTGIGFEFASGTTIDARYIIGLTDAIETGPNQQVWLETENNLSAFQLTIGRKIPFFD